MWRTGRRMAPLACTHPDRMLVAFLVVALTGCTLGPGNGNGPAPMNGAPAHVGVASLYPDPALTPGDTFPGVTQAQVCEPGYSKSVRSVTSDERAEVYRRYGVPNEPGKHEVDHFISLELGGSNMLTNLWPEPYEPRPGAHEKDRVENYLHDQMCNGTMTLAAAQQAIRSDWYAVYLRIEKQP